MCHTVNGTQTYVRESHASNVLSHSHSVASLRIRRLVDSCLQVAYNHLDSLDFEHVAHLPSTLGDEALDSVSESVETRCCCERAGQSVHQFGIDDSDGRDVVRIDTNHLLLVLLVGDDVVDSNLGCCSGCSRQGDDGH